MKTNILSFLNTDIAKKFEANFRARHTISFAKFIVEYGSKGVVVSVAFSWVATPEGFEFWNTISELWKKFLKEGGEPMPENQDISIETLTPEARFYKRLEEVKLSPKSVMDEFRSLFGEKIFKSFDTNTKLFGSYKDVEDIVESRAVSNLVALSFVWSSTPEGFGYWKKISDMWREYWEAKTGMRTVKVCSGPESLLNFSL